MDEKLSSDLPVDPNSVVHQRFLDRVGAVAPKGWRLKLAKAAAQLIAGSEKGAIAYGEIRERIDTIEGRSTVSKALADAVAHQAVQDPDVMERAKARFLGDMSRKQSNLEAVIEGAGQQLLLLPPPDDTSAEPDMADGARYRDDEQSAPGEQPLNSDWAATFSGLAENASTDELRTRLSKVLAGEITSPGTYSRATVRQIAELEREDLEAMRAIISHVFLDQIFKTNNDPPVPNYDMLHPLVEAGLLTDTNSLLAKNWPAATEEGANYGLIGLEWGLVIQMKLGQSLNLRIGQLTRTGSAVVDLLGRPDERIILKKIASYFPEDAYKRIVLGRKSSEMGVDEPMTQLYPPTLSSNLSSNAGMSPFGSVTFRNLDTDDSEDR